MKIRTNDEIRSIDSSLNLFEDTNWDFFGVLETQEPNYEYFNDVRDSSFDRNLGGNKTSSIKTALIIFVGTVALVCMVFIGIKVVGLLDKDDYNNIQGISGVQSNSGIVYVEGTVASNNDTRQISQVLDSYCRTLQAENGYDDLYEYCKMTSSFGDTYNSFTNKIEIGYDLNDCYARSLRKFGGLCSLSEVTKVVEKDDIYYCYAKLTIPSKSVMYEYVYENQYNFTKHFTSNVVSEEEIVRYMIEVLDTNSLPITNQEVLIKFIKLPNGDFRILDDSIITSSCIDAYTECVTQITKIIGGTKLLK